MSVIIDNDCPDIETVNKNLLSKLNELILEATEPDQIASLTDSVAKYNTSIRNNDIFSPKESEEAKIDRQKREIFGAALKGEEV